MSKDEPKVRQFNLARFIKDALRKTMPNVTRWELVKHNGKMAVKVEELQTKETTDVD
jgi:hypothetical protein